MRQLDSGGQSPFPNDCNSLIPGSLQRWQKASRVHYLSTDPDAGVN
jgi:hypothetical protein